MIVASSKLADEPAAGAVDGWFDAPSGLPGAAFWDAILATEAARWVRYERPATIVLAEIVGLDLQADGGTHVAHTGEIGAVKVTGYESKGRINKRIRIEVTD